LPRNRIRAEASRVAHYAIPAALPRLTISAAAKSVSITTPGKTAKAGLPTYPSHPTRKAAAACDERR
jgi:hypothetical protein